MQRDFNGITYLVGNQYCLEHIKDVPALPIFSDSALEFLNCLSKELLKRQGGKRFGDIAAFAFWIRKASMEKSREEYSSELVRIGRGLAFQVAPSNIPVQFAVSLVYALIAGNASVIRVSNKEFEQVRVICDAINFVIKEQCSSLQPYICIIRYNHDASVSEWLSAICDVRMIWGGDDTIKSIRKNPVAPRAVDIGFADRFSIAVIDADEYLRMDCRMIAADFYNDTYYTDQNACSSTRLVVWTGNNIDKAKTFFWEELEKEVAQRYVMNDISGSEKLLLTAVCASVYPGIREIRDNNMLVRLELPELYEGIMKYKGNSGYFFEYETNELESLLPVMSKECQTITFIGSVEQRLRRIVMDFGVRGVDRIVPVGHSMDLSFTWDGYNMPIALSREISYR